MTVILFLDCNEQKHDQNESSAIYGQTGYYSYLDIKKWDNEYLPFDSIFMNGKMPLVTDTNMLFRMLGRPDKVIPIQGNRNNCLLIGKGKVNSANYLIYGNTIFEQAGKDVIVNTIDFASTNVELVNSKINIKEGLRPMDIQKIFPESGRLLGGMGGSQWTGNIMVSASKPHGGIHDVWFFIFLKEKLKRVVLFSTSAFMEDL